HPPIRLNASSAEDPTGSRWRAERVFDCLFGTSPVRPSSRPSAQPHPWVGSYATRHPLMIIRPIGAERNLSFVATLSLFFHSSPFGPWSFVQANPEPCDRSRSVGTRHDQDALRRCQRPGSRHGSVARRCSATAPR